MKTLFRTLLLVLVFTATNCYDFDLHVYETLTIKKGKHRSTPYNLTWNNDRYVYYEWVFSELSTYDLGDSDQCDWNKLTGASFHLYQSTKNSIMVAWRYDRDGFFWVAPYYHANGSTYWADVSCTDFHNVEGNDTDLPAIKVEFGDILETHLNITRILERASVTIINKTTGETSFFEHEYDFNIKNSREVYPFFGGNEKAPNDIQISRRLMARE